MAERKRDLIKEQEYREANRERIRTNDARYRAALPPGVRAERARTYRRTKGSVRMRRKAVTIKTKGGQCEICGDSRMAVLTLHHPEGVERSVRGQLWFQPLTTEIRNEIRKCELLCHNCHGMEHTLENQHNTAQDFLESYRSTLQ